MKIDPQILSGLRIAVKKYETRTRDLMVRRSDISGGLSRRVYDTEKNIEEKEAKLLTLQRSFDEAVLAGDSESERKIIDEMRQIKGEKQLLESRLESLRRMGHTPEDRAKIDAINQELAGVQEQFLDELVAVRDESFVLVTAARLSYLETMAVFFAHQHALKDGVARLRSPRCFKNPPWSELEVHQEEIIKACGAPPTWGVIFH
jgi:hypothetical protein